MQEAEPELSLLTRHLSGITTEEEEEQLRIWLAADRARQRMLDAIRQGWETPISAPGSYDTDAGWSRVTARIGSLAEGDSRTPPLDEPETAPPILRLKPRAIRRRPPWQAAAALFLVVGASILWGISRPAARIADSAFLEVLVPRGQKAMMRLPDGSRVVLAPDSRLRYPRDFGEDSRDLQLEGMAYFSVIHRPDLPFVVHAAGARTRVLGTRFVVRAYPDASRVEVAVEEGRVALRADASQHEEEVSLTPGQVGRLGRDGIPRVESRADAAAFLGWMEGRPVIQDLLLPEALSELERWYDVKLAIGDSSLAARRITTSLERASLDETLTVIALALDARFVTRGDSMVILHNR